MLSQTKSPIGRAVDGREAAHEARRVRAAEVALKRMGSPLFAGAATTLGAAISLSLCTFTVLSKIGLFIAFATIWSWVTAQTLLPALLAMVGCGGAPVKGRRRSLPSRSRVELEMESKVAPAPVGAEIEL